MEQEKNPMFKINKLFKSFIFPIIIMFVVAVISTPNLTYNVHAETQDINTLVEEEYRKELSLNLPGVIDDPNLEVIFANPSDDKKHPITIIIDGKEFKKAKSPFKLPNLDIGTHTIVFKYTNKDGIPRTLKTIISIVPKAPVIDKKNKTLFSRPEPITINGQALAFSKVMAIINGSDVQYVPVNAQGKWSLVIKTPKEGNYNIIFYTYKNGLISKNYAKLTVTYQINKNNQNSHTSQSESNIQDKLIGYIRIIKSNKTILYASLGTIIFILSLIFIIKIKRYLRRRWEEKEIAELIEKQKPKKNIVSIVKKVQKQQVQKQNKGQAEKQTTKAKKQKVSSKRAKNTSTEKVKVTQPKEKTNQTSTKKGKGKGKKANQEAKTTTNKSQKIKTSKKVLSKEEFLQMFEKTKK